MKKMKRVSAILLIVILTVGILLSGCSGKSVEDMVAEAIKNTENVTSMDSQLTMDMGISVMGITVNMSVEGNITYFADPLKMKMDMGIDGMGENVKTEMYVQQKDGMYEIYTQTDGSWNYETVDEAEFEAQMGQFQSQANMNLFLQSAKDFKLNGEEDINGSKAVKVEGVISGEELKKVIKESLASMQSATDSGSLGEGITDQMFENLGDMPITIWIDMATMYPVKYDLDMSDILNKLLENAMSGLSSEEGQQINFSINEFKMSMTSSNFNSATDFEIPAEALAADPDAA